MREWYAATELAGLPGMPGTSRAVQYRAKRQAWLRRHREGRGGGREYHIDSLPIITREALRRADPNGHILRLQDDVLQALQTGEIEPDTPQQAVTNGLQAIYRLQLVSPELCKEFIAGQALAILNDENDDVHAYIERYKAAQGGSLDG